MPYCSSPEETTLLEDLLAASDSLYHRNVATIQRVFAEQYRQTLAGRQAQNPRFREERLQAYRYALKEKQDEMIEEQRELWRQRNANIHAYVATHNGPHGAAA
jgi:hypothetical protein